MTTLLSEGFDDGSFGARGWYDIVGGGGTIDTVVVAPGSSGSVNFHWNQAGTVPAGGYPGRRLFAASESVYVEFWMKLGTAGVPWQGSGVAYHPHLLLLLTDANGDFDGYAWTYLTCYIEPNSFTPRVGIQDGQRMHTTTPYPQTISPGLLGGAANHSVAGGNGGQLQTDPDPDLVDWYSIGGGDYANATLWDSPSANFANNAWHRFAAYFAMNSISGGVPQANGVIRCWVDGLRVVNHANVYLRTAQYATQKFNQLALLPYIGDGSPIAQDMWIDSLTVADQPPALVSRLRPGQLM